MDQVDCIVVGAGVVGLATARALALSGREVLVLERNPAFGMETSSRNSEVIHAGMYYPTGSLKARWCVQGREMLYHYSRERGIAHRACGKFIVATAAAVAALVTRPVRSAVPACLALSPVIPVMVLFQVPNLLSVGL